MRRGHRRGNLDPYFILLMLRLWQIISNLPYKPPVLLGLVALQVVSIFLITLLFLHAVFLTCSFTFSTSEHVASTCWLILFSYFCSICTFPMQGSMNGVILYAFPQLKRRWWGSLVHWSLSSSHLCSMRTITTSTTIWVLFWSKDSN